MADAYEFFPIPEEMKAHLREQHDKVEMANDMYRHDVQRLFEELSVEHLATLRKMLFVISSTPSPRICAAHYEGYAAAILGSKYHVCTGCGVNHDEEAMQEFTGSANKGESDEGLLPEPDPHQLVLEFPTTAEGEHPFTGDVRTGWSEEDLADMKTYDIEDTWNQDTGSFIGFVCNGCGMVYSSIEDRKLKAPDECSGCIQKTKWG